MDDPLHYEVCFQLLRRAEDDNTYTINNRWESCPSGDCNYLLAKGRDHDRLFTKEVLWGTNQSRFLLQQVSLSSLYRPSHEISLLTIFFWNSTREWQWAPGSKYTVKYHDHRWIVSPIPYSNLARPPRWLFSRSLLTLATRQSRSSLHEGYIF